jgi:hypothetical protein
MKPTGAEKQGQSKGEKEAGRKDHEKPNRKKAKKGE